MQNPLMQTIEALAKDKGIEAETIITAIEDAVLTASRKYYKTNENLKTRFNQETGQVDLFAGGIGRQLLVDQLPYFGALPARQRKHGVHARKRVDPSFDRPDIGLHVLAARQPDDGLGQRQRVLGAMIDLPRQQVLPLLGLLALGDVDGDTADADHAAALVGARRRRAHAPPHLAVWPPDTEFRLV